MRYLLRSCIRSRNSRRCSTVDCRCSESSIFPKFIQVSPQTICLNFSLNSIRNCQNCFHFAEGSGKSTNRDRKKFYAISMGSLRETQALLSILGISAYDELSDKLGAHLYRLMQNPGAS